MKIVSFVLFKIDQNPTPKAEGAENDSVSILYSSHNLSSFGYFAQSSVKEMSLFFTKTFALRIAPGTRDSIAHEGVIAHIYVKYDLVNLNANSVRLGGCLVTDFEYPARIGFGLIFRAVGILTGTAPANNTTYTEFMDKAVVDYQDPTKFDKLELIQKELDETKEIMHDNIEKLLERGVKLDDLVQRSEGLSTQSKLFYKQAKKMNSCCGW